MANFITRNIPNTLTCGNLVSGCIATVMALGGDVRYALIWIIIGAVFDFFDGMSARLFGVSSPIGKELDSLADDVTFGVAPSAIVFAQLSVMGIPHGACQRRAVHPLLRIPYRSILSPSPREVQPRHTPDHLVHRHAHPCQRPLLGFAARLTAHTHRVVSMDDTRNTATRSAHKPPFGQRAAHVRPEIQAVGMARQRASLFVHRPLLRCHRPLRRNRWHVDCHHPLLPHLRSG